MEQAEHAYVNRVLQQLEQAGMIEQTYACQTWSPTGNFWRVIQGGFASVQAAREVASQLPAHFRSNNPFVQNIGQLDCLEHQAMTVVRN